MVLRLLLAWFAVASPASDGPWVNVTSNVGGEKWGYAGVCLLAAVPDRDEIVAGVSESGLWASSDGGGTWRKLGEGDPVQIKHRPHQILFDPKDARTFWVSGCYGDSPFRTTDGGRTFRRLGKLGHADGIGVDVQDPGRKTLLLGLHEQSRSLHVSRDGGETWEKIGDKLPEGTKFSTDPIVLDAKTFLVNAAGWGKGTVGLFRSEDGGQTWTKVSEAGPSGRSLVASDGTIYWAGLKSADRGLTWTNLGGPVKSTPVELPGKKLAALVGQQLHVSADGGKTWDKLGDPLPIKAGGIAYSAKRNAFYAWRSTEKKVPDAVFRWDVR